MVSIMMRGSSFHASMRSIAIVILSYLNIYCVTHERWRGDDAPVLVISGVCRLNRARFLIVLVGLRWLRLDILVWLEDNVLVCMEGHRDFHGLAVHGLVETPEHEDTAAYKDQDTSCHG